MAWNRINIIMKTKLLILSIIVLLVGCGSSSKNQPKFPLENLPTQTQFGQDWLAAQHPGFNLGAALESMSTRRPIGVLDYTFGESMEPIELILKSNKVNHFRVHFINGPCIRNKNCGSYEYGYKKDISAFNKSVEKRDANILNKFISRVKNYCDLIDKYQSTRFYFSWVLEHNLSINAWKVLNEEGKKVCARNDYYTVNNPVGGHPFPSHPIPGVLYESHHQPTPGLQINSTDGLDIDDINVHQWRQSVIDKNIGIGLIWTHVYNCRNRTGAFQDPRIRTNCPTKEMHERYNNMSLQ